MKRHLLILTSLLVLFVFSASIVFASIALPPSDPGDNPPGKLLSEEERALNRYVKACKEQYDEEVKYCGKARGVTDPTRDPECIRKAQIALQACYEAAHFLANPPKLKLPNSGSPGQDN